MITIRKASNSDQQAWDNYVTQHSEHSPYHLFAWQYAVQAAYQHKSHYLIAEKSQNNKTKIIGVLPLIIFLKPFSKPSLSALPFCDIGGVLSESKEVTNLLIEESKNVAKKIQAKTIEIRSSNANNIEVSAQPKEDIKAKNQKVSMLMSLPESSEVLFSNFKSKLRSQIRKADKNGLTYKLGSEKSLLDDFYNVFSHNMRALGSPVHAKQWFISLLEYYKNNMLISIVYKDDIAIGAGIVVIAGNKAAIPWASTKAEFNRLSPNMMLYWSFLKHLSDNGINEFDFGRSSYGEGTFKFKQQWGAKPAPLDWQVIYLHEKNNETENEISTNSSDLRNIVENIWRKLPLSFTVFLGPKIRKYISL